MARFKGLFWPAYCVTLIAVSVSATVDHLGRGATAWNAVFAIPIWIYSAAVFSLPFVLGGSAVAFGLLWLGGDWWGSPVGRILFPLIGAVVGAAVMVLTIATQAPTAAVAGGVAAWSATASPAMQRWRTAVVVTAGLAAGLTVGAGYY